MLKLTVTSHRIKAKRLVRNNSYLNKNKQAVGKMYLNMAKVQNSRNDTDKCTEFYSKEQFRTSVPFKDQ